MTPVTRVNSLFAPVPLPRTVFDLADPGIHPELVLRVDGARVVFADYPLLREDFPQLAGAPPAAIDEWLLRAAAVVSEPQAAQETVNTKIATTGEKIGAFRPPLYGRAVVTSPDGGGLLDVKGTGVAPGLAPLNRSHANGLLALGEALANMAIREVMERIFRRANTGFSTVPDYAVIDLGFDVRDLFGPSTPACAQVRRAHRRPPAGIELPLAGSPEQQLKLEIEILLRHYGMTSCSPATSFELDDSSGKLEMRYADKPMPPHSDEQMEQIRKLTRYEGGKLTIEGVNVQLTRESGIQPSRATAIDFGHYSVRERFELPVVSLVRDRLIRWGGALWPGDPHFPRPSARLCLPLESWGTPDKPYPR
ncbi:MAG: hypothetical protein JWO56_1429 [Acidobacteria bacterium]|nr:hypothetical protein [Acidobacteriota bacterium]